MKSMMKNKKGNVQDVFYAMALIFGIGLSLFIVYFIYTEIQTPLGDNLKSEWADAPTHLAKGRDALRTYNALYPFFLAGLIVWVVISAFFIKSYPFFFWIGVFLLIIAILLGVILANVHKEIVIENEEFKTAALDFETTNWIINKLPWIALVVFFLIALALWAKPPGGGGEI